MAENKDFLNLLQDALDNKYEYYSNEGLPELEELYKSLLGCTKNLQEVFLKKTIISPNPYNTAKRQDFFIPETSSFTDKEASSVFGPRYEEYICALNALCGSFNFSIENLDLTKLKMLYTFNGVFQWNALEYGSQSSNTTALAKAIKEAKNNTPEVIISMIDDCVSRNADTIQKINFIIQDLVTFQKELYKLEVRNSIIESHEFNKQAALASPEAEMTEIKHNFTKVFGKKPFYTELIKEIIDEDQAPNKENLQKTLLTNLAVERKAKKKTVSYHEMLMNTILTLSALAPTLGQLRNKVLLNLDLVFKEKNNFGGKILGFIKKLFGIRTGSRMCALQFNESGKVIELDADLFISDLTAKAKLFNSIGTKGNEYSKLTSQSDEELSRFIDKQISECQTMYTKLNSLDDYFKRTVDVSLIPKIKGTQIERTAMRNSLVNANNKRSDYQEMKEAGDKENTK